MPANATEKLGLHIRGLIVQAAIAIALVLMASTASWAAADHHVLPRPTTRPILVRTVPPPA